MTELIVVLAIAVLLAGLLLPGLSQVREQAHRVFCANNLRQQGLSLHQYITDNGEQFPYASFLDPSLRRPQELMAVYRGKIGADIDSSILWDGLGLLYSNGYCDSHEVFYCPSHHGGHFVDKYAHRWGHTGPTLLAPLPAPVDGESPTIYCNYQYAGHMEWEGNRRRNLNNPRSILITDGFATKSDFNHIVGMNALRADGSVTWTDQSSLIDNLPTSLALTAAEQSEFDKIWGTLEGANH